MAPRDLEDDDETDFEGLDLESEDDGEEDGQEDEGDADQGEGDEARQGRQEDGEGDRQPRRESRASKRIQALTESARTAEERATRAERQVQEFLDNQRRMNTAPDPRAEQERLALMTPDERIAYQFDQMRNEFRNERLASEARIADQNDRTAYSAKAATNAIYRKYEGEVERLHQDLRSKGQNVAREAILKFRLGEKMLEKASIAAPKQRRQGKENIQRQNTKPGNRARQDVQQDRQRRGDTPASRLDGVSI